MAVKKAVNVITILLKNDIVMHSTHNEGKSIVAARFIRTLKNKNFK